MTVRERIQQETEQWFLTEPLFFTVYCTHRLKMNVNMQCALRSGQGRIEYNPEVIDGMKDMELSAMLRVELIRILLQHPYARQPLGCKPIMLHKASDMVISPVYHFGFLFIVMEINPAKVILALISRKVKMSQNHLRKVIIRHRILFKVH